VILRRQLDLLLCAVQFLTRLPVPPSPRFQPDWITASVRYFPLVGQVVGLISGLTYLGARQLWSGPVAAVLAIGLGVLVTGAFHEDGLADTADGLGGGQTPERRLEIMKDSRVGTYGVLAIGLTLAAKAAALASLAPMTGALVLLASHGAGRAAAVVVMGATPYAPMGQAGKWKPVPQGAAGWDVAIAVALGLWPLALLPFGVSATAVAAGGLLAAAVALAARRLIGGHTGDVLGAAEQLFELGFVLAAAAIHKP
jgi:adenosylcobinamide-GDP ribazoletransferase